ncbi:MAG: hypothetical protein ACLTSX_12745 [Collinsella sp.]
MLALGGSDDAGLGTLVHGRRPGVEQGSHRFREQLPASITSSCTMRPSMEHRRPGARDDTRPAWREQIPDTVHRGRPVQMNVW